MPRCTKCRAVLESNGYCPNCDQPQKEKTRPYRPTWTFNTDTEKKKDDEPDFGF